MRKQLMMICSLFILLSVAIVGTSVISYPERADAYMNDESNYTFKINRQIQNGYQVSLVGVGYRKWTGSYVLASGNIQTAVFPVSNSNDKLISQKIIQTIHGSRINFDIRNPLVSFQDQIVSECEGQSCIMQQIKTINGMIMNPQISVRVELRFQNGSYTIYSSQIETKQ